MPSFDIAGRRGVWFIISLLVIVPGMLSMVVRGFNFGIDFTGGTIIDLRFEQPVSIAQIRDSLRPYGLGGSVIQLSGGTSDVEASTDVMIRTVDLEENDRKTMMASVGVAYEVMREEKVGAVIGGELIRNAMAALAVSWVLIVCYIAYRFELRFGIAAVIALVHDVLVVLGVFSITGRGVDSSAVAAVLTVIGYSINDTIVIFGRICENPRLYSGAGVFLKRGRKNVNHLYQTMSVHSF